MAAPSAPQVLEHTVVALERHAAQGGWDRPSTLYALVDTAELVRREPQLAGQLGVAAVTAPPGSLTPIEQENLPDGPLDEVLAGITWPPAVLGAALVHEALVLPPGVEADTPDDDEAAAAWAAAHPQRRDVRFAVAVLRDGGQACVLRVRPGEAEAGPGQDGEVLCGPNLAPGLVAALLATLH